MAATVSKASPVDVAVGARLRTLREEAGLHLTTCAAFAGIPVHRFKKYEKGSLRISSAELHTLSKVLSVPLAAFFTSLNID